eukprot:109179-Prymnesium_polylepis.1
MDAAQWRRGARWRRGVVDGARVGVGASRRWWWWRRDAREPAGRHLIEKRDEVLFCRVGGHRAHHAPAAPARVRRSAQEARRRRGGARPDGRLLVGGVQLQRSARPVLGENVIRVRRGIGGRGGEAEDERGGRVVEVLHDCRQLRHLHALKGA